jgi:hypothetical protein
MMNLIVSRCDIVFPFFAPNASNQRLATLREPHRPILSRVRCIALFGKPRHKRLTPAELRLA